MNGLGLGHASTSVSVGEQRSRGKIPKPFVKWAGGKSQLLSVLRPMVPSTFARYLEPFVGAGALFFDLRPSRAYLSDTNPQLMNCYQVVKENVEKLIASLSRHVYEKEYYYRLRNEDRRSSFKRWGKVRQASRFIYLNKTCFNGLHRVNLRGEFNVPFGTHKNPNIINADTLRRCSAVLQHTQLVLGSFAKIERVAKPGDFVYFDPPYAPINRTSYFTSYTSDGFDEEMQRDLGRLCTILDKKNIKFMVSNSYTPLVRKLYKDFNIRVVEAMRTINSRADRRGKIREVVIVNY